MSTPKFPKILVVDDHPGVSDFLVEALNSFGYSSVTVFHRADEAVAFLQSGQRPDLVITDLRMPGGSGLDVMKAAKEIRPPVPCLVCSATWIPGVKKRILESGGNAVLEKPFPLLELRKKVEALLKLRD